MAKQQVCQRYIFKIHSGKLRKAKWNLDITLKEARENGEVVSLADSQILRWIDELNGVENADERARQISSEIRYLKKQEPSISLKRRVRKLYEELDSVQFKPDFMYLVIDREKDYYRACNGFTINGLRYKRLLGTNGGIKSSTIVFMHEKHIDEIRRRIENGRNMDKPIVPAKLEAYKSLTCSASIPVTTPNGVLIVPDCVTTFEDDIINLSNFDSVEPIMERDKHGTVELKESDGYGLILPSLAEKWSEDLHLDYVFSGVNTRFSFEKGMVFVFDFLDFAENVAGGYTVKDAWGDERDIREVELVLTTSMAKLWDSYDSCEDYINTSLKNGYTFCVSKVSPKELENERALNYQFVQSYELDDNQMNELIRPTVTEIKDILGDDVMKTLLFSRGTHLDERTILSAPNDCFKALMVEPSMIEDPYVRSSVYNTISKRIDRAKIGEVKVHGNYSIVCGDPYSLMQSIFGMEVTGLLKAGEIYNEYWISDEPRYLACFRAPMTTHNNIRKVSVCNREGAKYWYRHIHTCTMFNSWDTSAQALNGMDKDGDLVMLTDNPVLVDNLRVLPALVCAQRNAAKTIPTEEDFVKSNIASFGNDIGKTTNWITSMFEVRSQFKPTSEEYKILSYRICCGQLFQQDS